MLAKTKQSAESQVFARAAEIVERGWCQHRAVIRTGPLSQYCLVGALSIATLEVSPKRPLNLSDILGSILAMQSPSFGESLIEWNDNPRRTQQEVVDLLRDAAVQTYTEVPCEQPA